MYIEIHEDSEHRRNARSRAQQIFSQALSREMRVGIDFDNTIVDYDALFHTVASERQLIPPDLPPSKLRVRDYLRSIDKEDVWTEMQGYVYGARMSEAIAYAGVIGFLRWARDHEVAVSIVSHKTRHPFLGPKYDLHEAARRWVSDYLVNGQQDLVDQRQVFFELTKEAKIQRIADAECDCFIDDLPEILQAGEFPSNTAKILFDPERHFTPDGLTVMRTWDDIRDHIKGKWPASR